MNVHSIFESISGEAGGFLQGSWVTFIRLQKCNLRCVWCFGIKSGRRVPKITTAFGGNKKLNEVRVGDTLLTFDKNKNMVETKVTKVFTRHVDQWLEIKINNHLYFVTDEHPFFTNRGLVKAKDLQVGDEILHSTFQQKQSWVKLGNKNPMKNKEVVQKRVRNTDYKKSGRKISYAIKEKQKNGTYKSPWEQLSPQKKEEVRQKLSISKRGIKNPNWGGDKQKNYNTLKEKVRTEKIVQCSQCKKSGELHVHHKDKNQYNDNKNNLIVLCKSCHSKAHKNGYNFWKGERKDGKQLKVMNGYKVQAIKRIKRCTFPQSKIQKPLHVFNLQCAPYNSYLIDNMWVHNCDTKVTQDDTERMQMDVNSIAESCHTEKVLITGGEPLIHRDIIRLIETLQFYKKEVQVETNGSIQLPKISNVHWVVDYKCPSSGMTHHMLSLEHMRSTFIRATGLYKGSVWLKFVVQNEEDLDRAINVIKDMVGTGVKYVISPTNARGSMIPDIVGQIKEKNAWLLDYVTFSVQLHKLIDLP